MKHFVRRTARVTSIDMLQSLTPAPSICDTKEGIGFIILTSRYGHSSQDYYKDD